MNDGSLFLFKKLFKILSNETQTCLSADRYIKMMMIFADFS